MAEAEEEEEEGVLYELVGEWRTSRAVEEVEKELRHGLAKEEVDRRRRKRLVARWAGVVTAREEARRRWRSVGEHGVFLVWLGRRTGFWREAWAGLEALKRTWGREAVEGWRREEERRFWAQRRLQ